MNIKVACIVLLAIGVPAKEDRSEDDPKKVLQNLQGEWQMVRADFGKEAPPPDAKIGQTRCTGCGENGQRRFWAIRRRTQAIQSERWYAFGYANFACP